MFETGSAGPICDRRYKTFIQGDKIELNFAVWATYVKAQ
jgi:hypothetical protein